MEVQIDVGAWFRPLALVAWLTVPALAIVFPHATPPNHVDTVTVQRAFEHERRRQTQQLLEEILNAELRRRSLEITGQPRRGGRLVGDTPHARYRGQIIDYRHPPGY